MARSFRKIFNDSLSPCVKQSRPGPSDTSPAASTGTGSNGHITMRCFLVLTFWISVLTLLILATLYGGPKLWNLIGLMATSNSLP